MTTAETPLAHPLVLEYAGGSGSDRGRRQPSARHLWLLAAVAAIAWSCWDAGIGRQELVNVAGWPLMEKFWSAAASPELSSDFLDLTLDSTATTLAYAVLGTASSVAIGLVGGVLMSRTWWRRERVLPSAVRRTRVRPGWYLARLGGGLPRGIHEGIWGLFLLNALGRDPLVAILAIAIPFGAITAKVYSELIDDRAGPQYASLRAAGAPRLSALAYGILPVVLPDLVSYGFYRLECSIRAAVILGIIGAGGLGFQLALSFQSLAYHEMWTLILALALVSGLADLWSSSLRHHPSRTRVRASVALGIGLVIGAVAHLRVSISNLWSSDTLEQLRRMVGDAWPPRLPRGGVSELLDASMDTLQMSILAIAISSVLAVGCAFLAARTGGPARRSVAALLRAVLLFTRAIPPSVWALLVLFVLFPGPVPGAVALAIYNFGILGRLMAEVVENLDPRPARALRALGAPRASIYAYAQLPQASPQFLAYSLYRWEVATRETVVVGLVGAGGLGRLIAEENAAFDYPAMLSSVLAFIVLALVVDAVSTSARRVLR